MEYLGHLPKTDFLYQYLKEEIMPQIGVNNLDTVRVFGSKSSHAVYIYEDKISCKRVVGKFFAVGESASIDGVNTVWDLYVRQAAATGEKT